MKSPKDLKDLQYTDQAVHRDQIRGDGTSGFYSLSHSNIIWQSEKIEIEVRDKYHPEKTIKSTVMRRYQDYDINYVDGTIMFKQPVLSIDEHGNPRFILVFYEYSSTEDRSFIGGARYNGKIRKMKLGSTFLTEEMGNKSYSLIGADISLPVMDWLSVQSEMAISQHPDVGSENTQGNAFKLESRITPDKDIDLSAYYRNVSSDFVNTSLSTGTNELGSIKYGLDGKYQAGIWGSVTAEYYHQGRQLNTINESEVNVLNMFYNKSLKNLLDIRVGFENSDIYKKKNESRKQSRLFRSNLTYRMTKKLQGLVDHDQNIDGNDQSKPTQTAVGLGYEFSDKLRVFIKSRQTYGQSARNQTVIGFDSKVRENTEITGKYEIAGAIGESRNKASIGLLNKWQVSDNLLLNFAFENVSTMDSLEIPTPEHTSASVAFEYLPEDPFKFTGKQEFRKTATSTKWVTFLGSNIKLYQGFSTIAKINHELIQYGTDSNDYTRHQSHTLGLAYRPTKRDIFNCFGKLAFVSDINNHVTPSIRLDRSIASMHAYLHPWKPVELGLRFAHRQVLDEEGDLFSDKLTTNFYSARLELDLTLSWGLAFDARMIELHPVNEIKTGMAGEINYVVLQNMQLGLGYAFKRYQDPDFSFLNSDVSGVYLTINMKMTERIFD